MDWTKNDAWFSHAGALGTVGLVGALLCALLAIVFLIKQYKGHEKAPKFTRLFLILGVLFLLMARFAPQENVALSEIQDSPNSSIAQTIDKEAQAFTNAAEKEIERVEDYVSDIFHESEHDTENDISTAIQDDDQEMHELEDTLHTEVDTEFNKDMAELDTALHEDVTTEAEIEAATEASINELVDGDDFAHASSSSHANSSSSRAFISNGPHSVENEALATMKANALKAARDVEGVDSAMWNQSMLPELQLDVVANVSPESAIPLMNTLCSTLAANTVQATTVSVKDLEGGHIARQMCGVLTQGVD